MGHGGPENCATARHQILPLEFTIKDRSLADWLSWAREHLAQSNPLRMGAERIFTDIAQVQSWTYRD